MTTRLHAERADAISARCRSMGRELLVGKPKNFFGRSSSRNIWASVVDRQNLQLTTAVLYGTILVGLAKQFSTSRLIVCSVADEVPVPIA